jgi:hypothetical protein
MATFKTNGLAGKEIIVQPSKWGDGYVLVTIQDRAGNECGSIALPAHTANMLAAALEHEAVNAYAIELKKSSENQVITLTVRDEKWIDAKAVQA